MSTNLKLTAAIVVAAVLGVAALAIAMDSPPEPEREVVATSTPAPVLTADAHRLSTAPDGKVTLVEFLDFECEACGALYPALEQLRERYDGRVTFAIRYFPNDGHFNAMLAALDMEQFERDVDDPATIARIQADKEAGLALGVQGTPTLFLNDQLLQLESLDQLQADIEAALAA